MPPVSVPRLRRWSSGRHAAGTAGGDTPRRSIGDGGPSTAAALTGSGPLTARKPRWSAARRRSDTADAPPAPLPKTPRRTYRTIEKIGSGSQSEVFLVSDSETHTLYVKKRFLKARMSESALREVQFLLKLREHPHIVTVYDAFEEEGRYFCLVVEFCDGGDLDRHIAKRAEAMRPFSDDEILDFAAQLASALNFAHRKSILHRDIKPSNIFVTKAGQLSIGDFGVAKELTDELQPSSGNAIVGTPYYLPPETVRGEAYTYKADMWALGVVLYQLAVLRKPFEGSTLVQLGNAIQRAQPEPLPPSRSSVLRTLIDITLAKDPAQRASAAQLMRMPALHSRILRTRAFSPAQIVAPARARRPAASQQTVVHSAYSNASGYLDALKELQHIPGALGRRASLPNPFAWSLSAVGAGAGVASAGRLPPPVEGAPAGADAGAPGADTPGSARLRSPTFLPFFGGASTDEMSLGKRGRDASLGSARRSSAPGGTDLAEADEPASTADLGRSLHLEQLGEVEPVPEGAERAAGGARSPRRAREPSKGRQSSFPIPFPAALPASPVRLTSHGRASGDDGGRGAVAAVLDLRSHQCSCELSRTVGTLYVTATHVCFVPYLGGRSVSIEINAIACLVKARYLTWGCGRGHSLWIAVATADGGMHIEKFHGFAARGEAVLHICQAAAATGYSIPVYAQRGLYKASTQRELVRRVSSREQRLRELIESGALRPTDTPVTAAEIDSSSGTRRQHDPKLAGALAPLNQAARALTAPPPRGARAGEPAPAPAAAEPDAHGAARADGDAAGSEAATSLADSVATRDAKALALTATLDATLDAADAAGDPNACTLGADDDAAAGGAKEVAAAAPTPSDGQSVADPNDVTVEVRVNYEEVPPPPTLDAHGGGYRGDQKPPEVRPPLWHAAPASHTHSDPMASARYL